MGTNTSYSPLWARVGPAKNKSIANDRQMILIVLSILQCADMIANIKPPDYLCLKV
jgi:hypothetical protein